MNKMNSVVRTAFITGGAQGLGAAMAKSFHKRGMNVAIGDIQSQKASELATSIDPTGKTAYSYKLDVSRRDEFEQVFSAAVEKFGTIDVLVNNAGITIAQPFFDITTEDWDHVLDINLRSVFFGCSIAGRHMREQGWGRIINLTSLAGQLGSRIGGAHYSVSKAGIISLTKVVARELAAFGVTVNAIAPAVVRAPVMSSLPKDRLAQVISEIPVGRIGEAEEVAALAVFLASEEAGYITGSTYDINGGQYMR